MEHLHSLNVQITRKQWNKNFVCKYHTEKKQFQSRKSKNKNSWIKPISIHKLGSFIPQTCRLRARNGFKMFNVCATQKKKTITISKKVQNGKTVELSRFVSTSEAALLHSRAD